MKAYILFRSRKGTTNAFGREIGIFLREQGIETTAQSIDDFDSRILDEADFVLLGCWTQGLFLMFQHPDKYWKAFAKKLPTLKGKKTGLFTTYKVLTGRMFTAMKNKLEGKADSTIQLKSRNNRLSDTNKQKLMEWITTI